MRMGKSKKRQCLTTFIILFLLNIVTDYYQSQKIEVLASAGMAIWFVAVYAFFEWAWDSKDYKKVDKK